MISKKENNLSKKVELYFNILSKVSKKVEKSKVKFNDDELNKIIDEISIKELNKKKFK
jgi:hypothetical protein